MVVGWMWLWNTVRFWMWCLFAGLWPWGLRPSSTTHGKRRKASAPSACRTRRKPAWVKREIIRLKAHMPHAGCRQIMNVFNRCHAAKGETVGKSHVAEVLRQNRYLVEQKRRQIKRKTPFAPAANAVWAIDLTGKQDTNGNIHSILGVIDHGTRRLLRLEVPANKCAWTLLGHLCLTIGRYGKPGALRSDNERIFTGKVFTAGLRLLGIRHQRTAPGCPWQNGRMERMFGTLKDRLDHWCVSNKAQLSHALELFAFWYNAVRPHQNLNGATPLEAWAGIDPYRKAPKQALWFQAWDGLLSGFYMRR